MRCTLEQFFLWYPLVLASYQFQETAEEVAYIDSIRADPLRVDLYKKLAASLFYRGAFNESARVYEAALRVNPRDVSLHYNLGLVLEEIQELTKAAHHYQEAFQLQPLNAEAESRAGILLAQLGRYAEAEQLLASSLAQERRADVLYSQSVVLWKRGKLTESERHLEEALQADADIVAISQGKSGATGHFDEISSAPSSAAELRRVLTQVCQCRGEFHAKASCAGDAEERLLRLAGEAPLELWLQLPEELRQARPHAEIADGFLPRGQLLKLRILENKRFLSEVVSNWTGSFNNTCFVKGSQALVSSWMLPGQGQHLLQQQRGLCNELLQRSQGQRQMVIKPTNLAFGAGATLWNLSEDAQLTQESCLLSLQEMFQKVQEGISTNLDDVIVQEFVHSLTMKGRKLELRAHVLVASTNPLIVLWDPNVLWKWGTVPLPEGWILSGPLQQREEATLEDLAKEFGKNAAEELHRRVYREVRRGLAIILESLLEVTGGNLTWPTDLANSWEIMGVDFTISGPLSEVSLKVLDWNYGPGLSIGRQCQWGSQEKTMSFLKDCYQTLAEIHRARTAGNTSAWTTPSRSRLEVLSIGASTTALNAQRPSWCP